MIRSEEVHQYLVKLKFNKSTGLVGISPKFLHAALNEISSIICNIINASTFITSTLHLRSFSDLHLDTEHAEVIES